MIHKLEFQAMGCAMSALVDSPSGQAPELLQQVPLWFENWEQSLSRFRENSELSRLNRAAGWPVQVSETLWDVFQVSLEAEQASNGLVTPTVLNALALAGYDRSFDQMARAPFQHPVSVWQTVNPLAEVTWDAAERTICLPLDVQLDFGGVGKGWAAQQAMRQLSVLGWPVMVNAGGDIALSAPLPDSQPWIVSVDNPFQPGEFCELLALGSGGGVATSGTDYRRWKQGGRLSHHIIDPRTGQPAQTNVISATVVAPTVTEAEMAAKTTLILGSQHAMEWLGAHPAFAALLILETGEMLYSSRMAPLVWQG
jgi:thiamine biosynthesis lipoprotein